MISWAKRQIAGLARWTAAAKAWRPTWTYRRIKIAATNQEPLKPKPYRLYVTSSSRGPTFGYLLCPCGCGETLHLRFLPNRNPRWDLRVEWGGLVSLTPSVWRQIGCRSHFVLTRGKVHWC